VAVGLDGDGFYTKAGQLSGGMRRRLSIAMSLVGDPPIIFMDDTWYKTDDAATLSF
jgi:ABC-type multidrug transport system ATPase subunit